MHYIKESLSTFKPSYQSVLHMSCKNKHYLETNACTLANRRQPSSSALFIPSLPLGHRQSTVLSADNRGIHKPQDRLRWPLTAVWHPTNSN